MIPTLLFAHPGRLGLAIGASADGRTAATLLTLSLIIVLLIVGIATVRDEIRDLWH